MPRDDTRAKPAGRYNGPPMTLGNMRANGVRTLDAWCLGRDCHHHRVLDVSAMADDVAVPPIHRPAAAVRAVRPSRRRRATELVGIPVAGRMAPRRAIILMPSLFWLVYRRHDMTTVQIVEAYSLAEARLRSDLETPGIADHSSKVTSSTTRSPPRCRET